MITLYGMASSGPIRVILLIYLDSAPMKPPWENLPFPQIGLGACISLLGLPEQSTTN